MTAPLPLPDARAHTADAVLDLAIVYARQLGVCEVAIAWAIRALETDSETVRETALDSLRRAQNACSSPTGFPDRSEP